MRALRVALIVALAGAGASACCATPPPPAAVPATSCTEAVYVLDPTSGHVLAFGCTTPRQAPESDQTILDRVRQGWIDSGSPT